MKYEVPVCEMLKFNSEDVITTSVPDIDYVPGGTDVPVVDANEDGAGAGVAGN